MHSALGSRTHSALDEVPLLYIPETGIFSAKQNFVRGHNHRTGLRISAISQNFYKWFLDGDGKVEGPAPRIVLHHRDIQTRPMGIACAEELRSGEEVLLGQIYSFAAAEPKIGRGKLLVDAESGGRIGNMFPVDDIAGIRRVVYVFHHFGGIAFTAIPVPAPGSPLPEGHRVFCRYRCS